MQKSIIERVFPKAKSPLLPQHHINDNEYRDDVTSPPRSESSLSRTARRVTTSPSLERRGSRSTSVESSRAQSELQPTPLSASIIHHDDPFISIDRATATLQKTIQSLLDFQSEALNGIIPNDDGYAATERSATPTRSFGIDSTLMSPRNHGAGVVPVRQPAKKKMTLRNARQGLGRSMAEVLLLKNEELQVTQGEILRRQVGLEKIMDLRNKRTAVQEQIALLENQNHESESVTLRQEAKSVEEEIRDLEERLMQLKSRHRHLLDRATQIENVAASELSSYKGTLTAIDQDKRTFLRRPPVTQSLSPRHLIGDDQLHSQDMFALRPDRRTIEMATEQWETELQILGLHETEITKEQQALNDGIQMWKETIKQVDEFESLLRSKMKIVDPDSQKDLLSALDSALIALHENMSSAQVRGWNLLFCAIGAEFEAFRQARELLAPDQPLPDLSNGIARIEDVQSNTDEDNDVPHADLLGEHVSAETSTEPHNTELDNIGTGAIGQAKHSGDTQSLQSSNESLKVTLRNLGHTGTSKSLTSSKSFGKGRAVESTTSHDRIALTSYESEDDDPGPDFLVSHLD